MRNLTLLLGGGAAVAVAIGAAIVLRPLPEVVAATSPDTGTQTQEVTEPEPMVAEIPVNNATETVTSMSDDAVAVEDTPVASIEPDAPTAPEPIAPKTAEFRFEPDGALLVMGESMANVPLAMLVDGAEVRRMDVTEDGTFLLTEFLGYSDAPRVMRLVADPDGAAVLSDRMFVLDANPKPVPQAEAEPEPASEAETVVDMVEEAVIAPETAVNTPQTNDIATSEDELAGQAEGTSEQEPATAVVDQEGSLIDTADVEAIRPEAPLPQNAAQNVAGDDEPVTPAAPATPAILAVGDDGVDVIQPAIAADVSPEVMSTVALDTITYDPEGEVVLQGRAVGSGFVQVYVDNAPVSRLPVDSDGTWRGDLPDVDTGVYTLRIDEVDAEGDVVSRIETPFQREDAQVVVEALAEETQADGFTVATRTVQPGATLWAIAEERYGNGVLYVNVFEANKDRIRDPDLIYPGQVFIIPEDNN